MHFPCVLKPSSNITHTFLTVLIWYKISSKVIKQKILIFKKIRLLLMELFKKLLVQVILHWHIFFLRKVFTYFLQMILTLVHEWSITVCFSSLKAFRLNCKSYLRYYFQKSMLRKINWKSLKSLKFWLRLRFYTLVQEIYVTWNRERSLFSL